MKTSLFYHAAAVLLLLFAVGHTLGFNQVDLEWQVDALVGSMRSTHFNMMGSSRTFWDLFNGTGLAVGVFFAFSAVLAWQLGGLPPEARANMRVTAWAFALCFGAITVVSVCYLFIIPIAFSAAITLCLSLGAWRLTSSRAG